MKYFTNIIKILAILLTLLCIIFYVNTEQNKQNVNFKQINIYPSELILMKLF